MNIHHIKYFVVSFLVLFLFGGRPAEFGKETSFFQGFLISKPIIRIGIGVNVCELNIRSSSGMKVYEVKTDYKVISADAQELRIQGHRERLSEKFVILVAQTKEKKEADLIAQDLKSKLGAKVYVDENTEDKINGIFQVKVGDFLTRGEALGSIKQLNASGFKDVWIIREEVTEQESKPLWIFVDDRLQSLNEDTVLYFIPSNPQSFLSFNGRDYRGIFVLKSSPKGIVLINIINIEDYLKGVVPNELSPYNFNELEALKAQAVAARTYAIKNLGLYKGLGFDLLDTPQSQVYRGMLTEHSLSSKAVEETKGEVALYKGELINALYTSTCGGKTENSENVFDGKPVAYLKSEECVYEKNPEWVLETKNLFLPIQVKGQDISQKIAYLISLKILPFEISPSFYRQPVSFTETVDWIQKALSLLGKKNDKFDPKYSVLNFLTLAHLLIDGFEWQERVDHLVLKSEAAYLTKDFAGLKDPERDGLAYLIITGIFPAPENIGSLDRLLTRGEVAFYLYRAISSCRDLSHRGIFKNFSQNKVDLLEDYEKKQFLLVPNVFLFRVQANESTIASRVSMFGGESVRWIESDGQVQFLEITYPPDTNVLDRSSQFQRWQVRKSREELEKTINQYYPIGRLINIVEKKRGESNRVIELLVSGTESQVIVTGLKIRWVLGLRDTLFTIDKEHDEEGSVTYFTFSGKGWGHGVGLCQVGAFGMALEGADYKTILKKYYQGIKIDKIY